MTDSDYPWEPPLAGTEVEDYTFTVKLSGQPIGALGHHRLGRQQRLGVLLRSRRHTRTALRALGRRRGTVPTEA